MLKIERGAIIILFSELGGLLQFSQLVHGNRALADWNSSSWSWSDPFTAFGALKVESLILAAWSDPFTAFGASITFTISITCSIVSKDQVPHKALKLYRYLYEVVVDLVSVLITGLVQEGVSSSYIAESKKALTVSLFSCMRWHSAMRHHHDRR